MGANRSGWVWRHWCVGGTSHCSAVPRNPSTAPEPARLCSGGGLQPPPIGGVLPPDLRAGHPWLKEKRGRRSTGKLVEIRDGGYGLAACSRGTEGCLYVLAEEHSPIPVLVRSNEAPMRSSQRDTDPPTIPFFSGPGGRVGYPSHFGSGLGTSPAMCERPAARSPNSQFPLNQPM